MNCDTRIVHGPTAFWNQCLPCLSTEPENEDDQKGWYGMVRCLLRRTYYCSWLRKKVSILFRLKSYEQPVRPVVWELLRWIMFQAKHAAFQGFCSYRTLICPCLSTSVWVSGYVWDGRLQVLLFAHEVSSGIKSVPSAATSQLVVSVAGTEIAYLIVSIIEGVFNHTFPFVRHWSVEGNSIKPSGRTCWGYWSMLLNDCDCLLT